MDQRILVSMMREDLLLPRLLAAILDILLLELLVLGTDVVSQKNMESVQSFQITLSGLLKNLV